MAIFADVTVNERHLRDFAIVVYIPNMADGPSK